MAVLFDLDGTIVGTRRKKSEMRDESARKFNIPEIDGERYIEVFWETLQDAKVDTRAPVFEKVLNEKELAEKVSEEYRKISLEQTFIYPDAEDVLQNLPVRKGLVTNGPRLVQWEKIRKLDLEKYFGTVVVSGEVGKSKPDPEIFSLALEDLESSPDESYYVGDYPDQDVVGAKRAGLTSVLINREGDPPGPKPDHEIKDLRELYDIV